MDRPSTSSTPRPRFLSPASRHALEVLDEEHNRPNVPQHVNDLTRCGRLGPDCLPASSAQRPSTINRWVKPLSSPPFVDRIEAASPPLSLCQRPGVSPGSFDAEIRELLVVGVGEVGRQPWTVTRSTKHALQDSDSVGRKSNKPRVRECQHCAERMPISNGGPFDHQIVTPVPTPPDVFLADSSCPLIFCLERVSCG